MNKQRYNQLTKPLAAPSDTDVKGLEELVKTFPYCQTAHILLAKVSKEQGNMHSEGLLKKAAAYAPERKHLKKVLKNTMIRFFQTSPREKQIENTPQETGQKESNVMAAMTATPVSTVPLPDLPPAPEVTSVKQELIDPPPVPPESKEKQKLLDELRRNIENLHKTREKANQALFADSEALQKEVKAETTEIPVAATASVNTPSAEVSNTTEATPLSGLPAVDAEHVDAEQKEQEVSVNLTPAVTDQTESTPQNSFFESIVMPPQEKAEAHPLVRPEVKEAPKSLLDAEDLEVDDSRLDESITSKHDRRNCSFSETDLLLNYLDFLNEGGRYKQKKKLEEEIIEKFIKDEPTIPPLRPDALPPQQEDLSSKSSQLEKKPVSENFAKILLLQGKKQQAIDIYQELMLRNPEKSSYFAAQIEKIKL